MSDIKGKDKVTRSNLVTDNITKKQSNEAAHFPFIKRKRANIPVIVLLIDTSLEITSGNV